jgi:hypothetical protein
MTDGEIRQPTRSEHLHAAQQNQRYHPERDDELSIEELQFLTLGAIAHYLAAIELDLHKIATRKASR